MISKARVTWLNLSLLSDLSVCASSRLGSSILKAAPGHGWPGRLLGSLHSSWPAQGPGHLRPYTWPLFQLYSFHHFNLFLDFSGQRAPPFVALPLFCLSSKRIPLPLLSVCLPPPYPPPHSSDHQGKGQREKLAGPGEGKHIGSSLQAEEQSRC